MFTSGAPLLPGASTAGFTERRSRAIRASSWKIVRCWVFYRMRSRHTCICRYTLELCGSPSINPSLSKKTFFGLLCAYCQSLKNHRKSRTYLGNTIFWNSRHWLADSFWKTVGAQSARRLRFEKTVTSWVSQDSCYTNTPAWDACDVFV